MIKTFPDKALLKECDSVEVFGDELQRVVDRMGMLMYAASGIGLAANQIGVSKQIVVMDAGFGQTTLINPRLENKTDESIELEEGCLSFPGLRIKIARPEGVTVLYRCPKGEQYLSSFRGLEARVVQHEMDHLVGKTMLDHLTNSERKRVVRAWAANRYPEA